MTNRLLTATAGVLGLTPESLARALGTTTIPLRRQPSGAWTPDLVAVRRLLSERAKPLFKTGYTP